MENKNIIIILLVIIVILAAAIGFMVLKPMHAKEPTKIKVTSNKTLYEGEDLSVKLTDLNKTPLSNEDVNITVKNDKGKVVANKTVKTDDNGNAKMDLKLQKGKYDVDVSYGGNENYTGNNTTQKLTVKEKEKVAESQPTHSTDTYVERTEGNLKYGYKDGRYGFWTPSGNFIEDKSRAISGQDPKEPFMRDGDFYSQL